MIMKDLTLVSDLYHSIKFNMDKLATKENTNDSEWLGYVFRASPLEVGKMLASFDETVEQQRIGILKKMKKPEVHGRHRIAFIGDSITSDRESYLRVIQKLYQADETIQFIDAAFSGDKSDDAKMKLYFRVIRHKPDIVHILLGTNDMRRNQDDKGSTCVSIRDYEKNMDYIVSILRQVGCKIVLSTISPVDNAGLKRRYPQDHWYYERSDLECCNQILEKIALQHQIILNDMRNVYGKFQPQEILLKDGLHLNELGQSLLLEHVLKCL